MSMDFSGVLGRVRERLQADGYECLLVGGLAMQALGSARATQDLDLVVDARARESLVRFMEGLGYETLYQSSAFSNHLHEDERLGRVDFLYVDPGTAESLRAAGRYVDWPGYKVLVPSPEHVVAMKVHAIKNDPDRALRELADIRFLLGRGIDRDRVRGYFEKAGLWERFGDLL